MIHQRIFAAPDIAVKAHAVHKRLQFQRLLPGAVLVQVDVLQRRAFGEGVRCYFWRGQAFHINVVQAPILVKRQGTDAFQRGGQIQLAQACAVDERAFADGFQSLGQGQLAAQPCMLKGMRADGAHMGQLQRTAQVRAAREGVVRDDFQRSGKVHMQKRKAVGEGTISDGFQPLGQRHIRQSAAELESVLAEGLHRHSADGFGDAQIDGGTVVLGNGAGRRVEIKILLAEAVVVHDHGAFAAGLSAEVNVHVRESRLIGFQLIVRHIGGRAVRQIVEGYAVERRAYALEGNALQKDAVRKRAVADIAHPCWNGHALQRVAVVKAVAADDHQALGQGKLHKIRVP